MVRTKIYLSKEALLQVSRNLEHQDSLSWEDTSQMLYNNSKKKGKQVGEGRGRGKGWK